MYPHRLWPRVFILAGGTLIFCTARAESLRHANAPVPPSAAHQEQPASAGSAAALIETSLPALPDGVAELKFNELYRLPVQERGLEYSDTVRRLDGRRVRILGYMVNQSQPAPQCLLLCSTPVTLHEDEWGFCEDLPATVIHVFADPGAPATLPFTPGPLLLTGTLSIGTRVEPDQRVSSIRLQLDPR
ncbi:MAG: hypothetical protein ABIZ04_03495 [Opitutus sp.]